MDIAKAGPCDARDMAEYIGGSIEDRYRIGQRGK
jgi:hypothetical protein